ncbi:sn-1-specific diacylglycerol lipase ABHD11-like isoform X1 [Hetaerina americana]|uniref:sn-1-specific diacylglycerol lipase ABHD11-like isoform X1 n=1 Tax=Hetaerina americana TaxID=62018 RepID=UPI003A7F1E81
MSLPELSFRFFRNSTYINCFKREYVRYFSTTNLLCASEVAESTGKDVTPVKMAYTSHESTKGPAEANSLPIIIMHGLLGSRNNWVSLSKALHNLTLRKIITVDARNHGDSPHNSEMSYHHLAEDVRALMENLNIPKASLIGHSMGGRAMMLAALKYPTLVENLVVVDISPVGNSPSLNVMKSYFEAMKNIKLEHNIPLSAARKAVDEQLRSTIKEQMLRLFLATNLVEDNGSFRWRVNLEAISENFFSNIAIFPISAPPSISYKGPTLFVCGEKSDYVRAEDHSQIKEYFPNAVFKYIPDAGHWVHADKPHEFLDIVFQFIQETS